MTVESVTGIWDFDSSLPSVVGPTGVGDPMSEGDNHIRNMKGGIVYTFTNVEGQVTASHTEMNYLVGVTSAIQTQLDAKLASASYTAADVLSKLLTVDDDDSGINATTINSVTLAELAQLSSADFTALQVGGADVATEAYADAAAPSVSDWLDVLDPIASGSAISSSGNIAHGRGQVPDNVILRLVCKGASGGYSANDVVMLQTSDASNVATEVNATNLVIRMWNLMYIPYGDGTNNLFDCRSDNTNWKLQAKAVVY